MRKKIERIEKPRLNSAGYQVNMKDLPYDSILLRIFIGESDFWNHQPLYEAIVLKARAMHLGGATVIRGAIGFGKSSRIHTTK